MVCIGLVVRVWYCVCVYCLVVVVNEYMVLLGVLWGVGGGDGGLFVGIIV